MKYASHKRQILYVWLHLHEVSKSSQILRNTKENCDYQMLGGGRKEELFNGYKLSDLQDENSIDLFPNNINVFNATKPYIQN